MNVARITIAWRHKYGAFVTALSLAVPGTALAEDNYGIQVETISDYSPSYCCNCPDGCNNTCYGCGCLSQNTAGQNFINQILSVNDLDLYLSQQWTDSNVWDSDFRDPNLAGQPDYADDTDNWDNEEGLAITLYGGHGAQMISPAYSCLSETNCLASYAPAGTHVGTSGYGACAKSPMSETAFGSGLGICYYAQPTTVNPTIDTCSSYSPNSNHAQFGYMALGENPTNGAWRGAGTNGGTSLAVIHMSFAMFTFYPLTQWLEMFAGVHMIASYMTSWDDIGDGVDWGSQFAMGYSSNDRSEVAQAWGNVMSIGDSGNGCTGSSSPAGGFNGCGCSFIMSTGATGTGAFEALYEAWYQLNEAFSTDTSTAYWYYDAVCNYNPSSYPWSGGDD